MGVDNEFWNILWNIWAKERLTFSSQVLRTRYLRGVQCLSPQMQPPDRAIQHLPHLSHPSSRCCRACFLLGTLPLAGAPLP